MRIAQVTARYSPSIGGVQTHVRRLAEGCASSGDQVTVLTHQQGDRPAEEWMGQVRVLRFPRTVKLENFPVSRELFRYLQAHSSDFDVVHSHDYHTVVSRAAARTGLPFVFTPHYHGTGGTPLRAMLHPVYRPLGGKVFAAANAVICVSDAERGLVVRDFPGAAAKVRVVPNGTDHRTRPVLRSASPAAARMVLVLGRLERYKNVDLLIRAFASRPMGAALVIAGEGPDRRRLEQLAASLGVSASIQFRGRVSDQDLDTLLSSADVVASASAHEAFGLAVADGLAAGARVVASDIPAHQEIGRLAGNGAAITFVNPADTRECAAALAESLDLGPIAVTRIKLPTWADVADRTRELYAQSCGLLVPQPREG